MKKEELDQEELPWWEEDQKVDMVVVNHLPKAAQIHQIVNLMMKDNKLLLRTENLPKNNQEQDQLAHPAPVVIAIER